MKKLIRQLLFLSILFLGTYVLQAESHFIKPATTWNINQLSGDSEAHRQKLEASGNYTDLAGVSVLPLSAVQDSGRITIELPDYCTTVEFRAKRVTYTNDSDYLWTGYIQKRDSCNYLLGEATFLAKNGQVCGHFTVNDDKYKLVDIGNGKHLLAKINFASMQTCGMGVGEATLPTTGETGSGASARTGWCPIRVLVLFNQNAVDADPLGNIDNTIALAMADTRTAFANSVFLEQTELVFVGSQLIDFEETNIIEDDVEALIVDPIANQLRDDFAADIVMMLVDGPAYQANGRAGSLTLEEDRAYTISRITAAIDNITFAHELAHLFGARHQQGWDDMPDLPEHGHRFQTAGWWFFGKKFKKTVMCVPNDGSRVLVYSSPDVYFEGEDDPTGIEDERDNVSKMIAESCTIADFRDPNPEDPTTDDPGIYADLYGPNKGWACTDVVVFADAMGGSPGNYTFFWETSLDGLNWTFLTQNTGILGVSAYVTLPCSIGTIVHVQCTVTSSTGQVSQDYHTIEVVKKHTILGGDEDIGDGKTSLFSNEDTIYPNPTKEFLHIHMDTEGITNLQISLVSMTGQEYPLVEEKDLQISHFVESFSISHLNAGVYIIKTQKGSEVKYERIFITR